MEEEGSNLMWGCKTQFVYSILANLKGMLQVISPELLCGNTKLTDKGKMIFPWF